MRWDKAQVKPSKAVTINRIPICLETAATRPNAENGSKNTGICLFDPYIFLEETFAPAETRGWPEISNYDQARYSGLPSYTRINMKHSWPQR
jgi:hypothetical protein